MDTIIKTTAGEINKSNINEEEMSVVHYISTIDKDVYDDVVIPDGIDYADFRKNPVVLYMHNSYSKPIAKNLWLKTDSRGVLAKTQFDKNGEEGAEIFRLIKEGFLNAWSIGFMINKFDYVGNTRMIKEWKLLEYSAVPIPANPNALTLALENVKCANVRDAIMQTKEYQQSVVKAALAQSEEIEKLKSEMQEMEKCNLKSQEEVKDLISNLEKRIAKKLYEIVT